MDGGFFLLTVESCETADAIKSVLLLCCGRRFSGAFSARGGAVEAGVSGGKVACGALTYVNVNAM